MFTEAEEKAREPLIEAGYALADILTDFLTDGDEGEYFDEIRMLLLDWDKAVDGD